MGLQSRLSRAGRVNEFRYVEAASQAAEFLMKHCQRGPGELLHGHCGGRATSTVFLDDYSHLLVAFLSLYEATLDCLWLERQVLAEGMIGRFHDAEKGGFFYNENLHVERLNRIKEFHDASTQRQRHCGEGLQRLGGMIEPSIKSWHRKPFEREGHCGDAIPKRLLKCWSCLRPAARARLIGSLSGDDATVNRAALRLLQARFRRNAVAFGTEAEHRTGPLAHLFEGRTCQQRQTLYVCKKNLLCRASRSASTRFKTPSMQPANRRRWRSCHPLVGQKRAGRPQACDSISQHTNRLPVQHRLVLHLPFEVLQSLDPC